MKYALLIYDDEQAWGRLCESDKAQIYAEYGQFTQEIKSSQNYISGAQFHPPATASIIRIRDGKKLVNDGPIAETHEKLGGYYLIEAKDLDEARSIAAQIPSARLGSIEVRQIVETPAQASA
jgi:hypothetical protein